MLVIYAFFFVANFRFLMSLPNWLNLIKDSKEFAGEEVEESPEEIRLR